MNILWFLGQSEARFTSDKETNHHTIRAASNNNIIKASSTIQCLLSETITQDHTISNYWTSYFVRSCWLFKIQPIANKTPTRSRYEKWPGELERRSNSRNAYCYCDCDVTFIGKTGCYFKRSATLSDCWPSTRRSQNKIFCTFSVRPIFVECGRTKWAMECL